MIIFTIIGVPVYWMLCFQIGEALAMASDADKGITTLLKPVHDEMQSIMWLLVAWESKAAAQEARHG